MAQGDKLYTITVKRQRMVYEEADIDVEAADSFAAQELASSWAAGTDMGYVKWRVIGVAEVHLCITDTILVAKED